MAFEKISRSHPVDAIFGWLVKVEFMAERQGQDFMLHAIKVMRDTGIVNKSVGPFALLRNHCTASTSSSSKRLLSIHAVFS